MSLKYGDIVKYDVDNIGIVINDKPEWGLESTYKAIKWIVANQGNYYHHGLGDMVVSEKLLTKIGEIDK